MPVCGQDEVSATTLSLTLNAETFDFLNCFFKGDSNQMEVTYGIFVYRIINQCFFLSTTLPTTQSIMKQPPERRVKVMDMITPSNCSPQMFRARYELSGNVSMQA